MSIETWKAEFYRTPAEDCPEENAVAHSLMKWRGMTKEVLKRHDVVAYEHILVSDDGHLHISGETCALCKVNENDDGCYSCILFKVRSAPCDMRLKEDDPQLSPFEAWVLDRDPMPMIQLLEQALKLQEETHAAAHQQTAQ